MRQALRWLASALAVVLVVGPISCAGGAEETALSDEALLQRIARVESGLLPAVYARGVSPPTTTLQEVMGHFRVPGVSIAVINGGALEWARGYGSLQVGGSAVNEETLFLAGHISQGVAAVAALRLVDEGHVGLDENVNERLVSWQVPDNEYTREEKVTLRRILSHTSGLRVPTSLGYSMTDPLPTLLQSLDGDPPARSAPVRVELIPGSAMAHSLGGYAVLQQLVEDIASVPYADFVHDEVLAPLGMVRSFHAQPLWEESAGNAAVGHERSGERVAGRWRVYPELAALGMWTTPSDLAHLAVALQRAVSGEPTAILSQRMAEEMLSVQRDNRGLGFEVGGEGEWRHFKLEGHGNNYLCDLFAYVSKGMGAVVMTNSSNGEAVKIQILRAIAAEYGWPDFGPVEIEVATLSEKILDELAGRYSYRGRDRELRVADGRIVLLTPDGLERELLPLSADLLVDAVFGYELAVERDEQGSVSGLTMILEGVRLWTWERVE